MNKFSIQVATALFFGIFLVFFSVIALHLQIVANDNESLRRENSYHELHKPKNSMPSSDYADFLRVEKKSGVDVALEKAKKFISDASATELEDSTKILHEAILKMKETLKKTLEGVLKYYDNVSDSDREDIKDEVYRQLEKDIVKKFKEEVKSYIQFNKLNLDSMIDSELNDETSNEDIERDIKYKSSFLVDNLSNQIDMLEKELEQSIHDRAQKIEKHVILDKVGVEISDDQLEESEIETHVSDLEKEVLESATESETHMYKEVSSLTNSYEEIVNKILDDFLVKQKGFSKDEVEEIEKSMHSKLDEEFDYLFGDETLILEDIVDDKLFELESVVDEDRDVLKGAKRLGMVPTGASDSAALNSAAYIEKDLNGKKDMLESSIRKSIDIMKGDIIDSLRSAIADIEKSVLKEKGVDLTQEELKNIIEIEKENMNKLIGI